MSEGGRVFLTGGDFVPRSSRMVHSSNATFLRLFECLLLLYLIALFYKLNALGIAALVAIAACGALFPARSAHLTRTIPMLAAVYVALATVTAFFYDFETGAYRTVQFFALAAASVSFSNYMANYWQERSRKLFGAAAVLCVLVLLHMIVHHIVIGRVVTWKYLFDTKTVLSILPVLCFAAEDEVKERFGKIGWTSLLLGLSACILLSGERKAYLLLGLLFFLSRASPLAKAVVALIVVSGLGLYVAQAPEEDYISRQLTSVFAEDRDLHISEFYLIDSISDQSNIIRDFVGRMAGQQFAEHPFLGLGAGGYKHWSENEFGNFEESGGLSMNVHGEVNRVPVESGMLGIAVAVALILAVILALRRDIHIKGRWQSSSFDRLPGYFFIALLTYTWYEALDTTMLTMIILCCLEVARIDQHNFSLLSASRGFRLFRGMEK